MYQPAPINTAAATFNDYIRINKTEGKICIPPYVQPSTAIKVEFAFDFYVYGVIRGSP